MDSIASVRARHPSFGRMVDHIRSLGTDSLSHFGNGYTHEGGYSLQQNPDEFAALIFLLRERVITPCGPRSELVTMMKDYIEIGSASGGSARLLYEQVGFPNMLSVDNHGHHRWVEQEANWGSVPIETWVGDSHSPEAAVHIGEWLEDWRADDGIKYANVAFIDGDHSYEGVSADVAMMKPYLTSGSLIILHDTIACEGVKRCFDETSAWAVKIANYVGDSRPLGIGVLEVQ